MKNFTKPLDWVEAIARHRRYLPVLPLMNAPSEFEVKEILKPDKTVNFYFILYGNRVGSKQKCLIQICFDYKLHKYRHVNKNKYTNNNIKQIK